MRIETIVVTPFQQNARIIIDDTTQKAAIVDPGGEATRIMKALKSTGAELTAIIHTHAHIDHVGGTVELLELCQKDFGKKPKVYAHPEDKELRPQVSTQGAFYGLPSSDYQNPDEPDVYVNDGDIIEIGSLQIKAIFTPGHAPGHIALYLDELQTQSHPVLLSGDALFLGSIGRTDLPFGHHATLIKSIKEKLLTLPDDTEVFPGHGPNTVISLERSNNPFLG